METGHIKVEVQPTYKLEQKVYINGYAPTDEDIAYSGILTIFLTDEDKMTNYVEVAEDATNKSDA